MPQWAPTYAILPPPASAGEEAGVLDPSGERAAPERLFDIGFTIQCLQLLQVYLVSKIFELAEETKWVHF